MHARAAPSLEAHASRADEPRWRAHDLLRIARPTARLTSGADAPDWLRAAFARTPFVVVRRAPAPSGFVAVGVRGATRAQRFGTWVPVADIDAAYSPEDLVASEPTGERRTLPAFVALALLRDARSALQDFAWGPTGSAGFELAAHTATVSTSSDLDLLIRTPERCDAPAIRALVDVLANASTHAQTRIDAQLDTPAGGVALAELAAGKPRVLARAVDGARVVTDPWGLQ